MRAVSRSLSATAGLTRLRPAARPLLGPSLASPRPHPPSRRLHTAPIPAAHAATHSQPHSHPHTPPDLPTSHRRTLLSTPEETLSLGPGYITYTGPAPSTDTSLASSSGSITHARLRDACPCPQCIHPSTRQKTHTSGEAARFVAELGGTTLSPAQAHIATASGGETGLEVHWPGGHSSFYPVSLLRRLTSGRLRARTFLEEGVARQLWTRETVEASDLWTEYSELQGGKEGGALEARPEVLLKVLKQLQRYGLAIVRGLPTDKTGNKECALRQLAESVGLVRNTFYGETWDVKSVVNSKNVAYTNLNLGLHMDLLYFALPPRFQLLHCLRNRVIGGASYFVDSFAAAEEFREARPDLYATLQRNPLEYEYDNDGHYLSFEHPVLPAERLDTATLHTAVHWSPPFQAPPVRRVLDAEGRHTPQAEGEFYTALSEFQAALDHPKFRYEFTMREGDVALFDNMRVLHARTAFRDRTGEEVERDGVEITPGEPTRWLKGLYLDGSTVWDKLAVLHDEVARGGGEGK